MFFLIAYFYYYQLHCMQYARCVDKFICDISTFTMNERDEHKSIGKKRVFSIYSFLRVERSAIPNRMSYFFLFQLILCGSKVLMWETRSYLAE